MTLYPDGTKVAITYRPTGEIETRTDARGTTTYAYDLLGRLTKQTNPDGGILLAWAFDATGHITERSSPQGTTRYQVDGNGKPP